MQNLNISNTSDNEKSRQNKPNELDTKQRQDFNSKLKASSSSFEDKLETYNEINSLATKAIQDVLNSTSSESKESNDYAFNTSSLQTIKQQRPPRSGNSVQQSREDAKKGLYG